jgi:hypothetical protein
MKVQRPGNTESNLLFCHYLKNNYPDKYLPQTENTFINWLYSTTGFYDKSINKIEREAIISSECYNNWLIGYNEAIKGSYHVSFYLGDCGAGPSDNSEIVNKYIESLNLSSAIVVVKNKEHRMLFNHNNNNFDTSWWSFEGYYNKKYHGVFHRQYDLLKDKTVLVVSSFSELVEYQHKNAVQSIFYNFPKFDLVTYQMPHTFLNDGPHNNFFQTLDIIFDEIKSLKFDIALLSCGTYAAFLADRISQLNKDAIYMGRGCNYMFGIDPNRDPAKYPLWITKIPNHLKYDRSKEIENGIYWQPAN